ncbi:MAG: hypothetical protein AAB914_03330 [Patescibacteria group bacterium]
MTRHRQPKPFNPEGLMRSLAPGNQRIRAEVRTGEVIDGQFGIGREIAYIDHIFDNLPGGGEPRAVEAFGSFVVPYAIGFKNKDSAAKSVLNMLGPDGAAIENLKDIIIMGAAPGENSPLSSLHFKKTIKGENSKTGQRLYLPIQGDIYRQMLDELSLMREVLPSPMKTPDLFTSMIDLGTFAKSGDAKRARKFYEKHIPGQVTLAGLSVIQIRHD